MHRYLLHEQILFFLCHHLVARETTYLEKINNSRPNHRLGDAESTD